jgi:lysophospholipase L1-like esterase
MPFKPHGIVLFQGDSITDAGRSRNAIGPNSSPGLGEGYPQLIADQLINKQPDAHFQIYNRGISGDRIQDLSQRWEKDTLRLQPDLLSILIGVNDTWNYIYTGMGVSPDDFEEIYRTLLIETRQHLPLAQLVLCEPFILETGQVTEDWQEDISQRQTAIAKLSGEFGGVLVPFQTALDQTVASGVAPQQLLGDGVHPTPRGHQLLTDCWLEAVLE